MLFEERGQSLEMQIGQLLRCPPPWGRVFFLCHAPIFAEPCECSPTLKKQMESRNYFSTPYHWRSLPKSLSHPCQGHSWKPTSFRSVDILKSFFFSFLLRAQNGWDRKGPLQVSLSSSPARAGPPTAGCPGQSSEEFWLPLRTADSLISQASLCLCSVTPQWRSVSRCSDRTCYICLFFYYLPRNRGRAGQSVVPWVLLLAFLKM